ncbi:MAG: peptidoglycan recognition protein family protein [Acidobacteriia bacterium]|nr:peptidoglycan recognition protein family protein [Terriglobia bacterium]
MSEWRGIVGQGFRPSDFDRYARTISFMNWRPQFVVLHNTAAPKLADWHSVSGQDRMLNLANFYQNVQRWSAGPHLFVADDQIWVFTPLNIPGVHSPSWNSISWGVELVGDYEVEPFGASVRDNVVSALASLHSLLGLDPSSLRLHKEDPRTTHNCPGKNVVKADVIQRVLDRMAALTPGEHQLGATPT